MLNKNETAPGTSPIVWRHFNEVVELEKQLRLLIDTKGSEYNVRDLRYKIRELYEAIVLEDLSFAENNDIEQALWRLHYKQIEEFRTKIRKQLSEATVLSPGVKIVSRTGPMQKTLLDFKSFLSESELFYHELILKTREKHGLAKDILANPQGIPNVVCENVKRCQLSCHRCLIYLGDLSRYKELHAEGNGHDWSVSADYYLKAISLWPQSGNPHNQLAVLATYVGDELLAVYRYFRSLAVDSPFVTAKDNLALLFEKNHQQYSLLRASTNESKSFSSKLAVDTDRITENTFSVGDETKLNLKEHNDRREDATISVAKKRFRVLFVRLNGILFTKMSLETFPDVYAATMKELENLLALDDKHLESAFSSEFHGGISNARSGAFGILQHICMLIFNAYNTNSAKNPANLEDSAFVENASIAAFELTGRLMYRCLDSTEISESPLLPAISVFLEWLVSNPDITLRTKVNNRQDSARAFFWRQCVALLNKAKQFTDMNPAISVSKSNNIGHRNESENKLWEDYELQGFKPIVHFQLISGYYLPSLMSAAPEKGESRARLLRLLAAGKAIAVACDGTGKGFEYDKESQRFLLPGDTKKISKHDLSFEDEDVIVFRPVSKNRPLQPLRKSVSTVSDNAFSLDSETEDSNLSDTLNGGREHTSPILSSEPGSISTCSSIDNISMVGMQNGAYFVSDCSAYLGNHALNPQTNSVCLHNNRAEQVTGTSSSYSNHPFVTSKHGHSAPLLVQKDVNVAYINASSGLTQEHTAIAQLTDKNTTKALDPNSFPKGNDASDKVRLQNSYSELSPKFWLTPLMHQWSQNDQHGFYPPGNYFKWDEHAPCLPPSHGNASFVQWLVPSFPSSEQWHTENVPSSLTCSPTFSETVFSGVDYTTNDMFQSNIENVYKQGRLDQEKMFYRYNMEYEPIKNDNIVRLSEPSLSLENQ